MRFLLSSLLIVFTTLHIYAQVGINNEDPDVSSILDITSTTSGVLIPRMTQMQRDNISSPATGLLIYQIDNTTGFYYYNGAWTPLVSGGGQWLPNGNDIYNSNSGNVGIGTNTPTGKLHIESNTPVPVILNQDFETAMAPLSGAWILQSTNTNTGTNAAESSNQGIQSSTSFMEYTFIVPMGGATLNFYQAVSSEATYDFLRFYIDGVQQTEISGSVGYQLQTYNFIAGSYTIRWAYEKDSSQDSNDDKAYVDDITISGAAPGIIRLVDGNQGDGKVLTSDASGNAAWQQLSAQSITDFPDIVTFQQMEIPICNTGFVGQTGSFTIPIKGVNTTISWEILVRQTTVGSTVNINGNDVLASPLRPEKLQVRYDFSPQLPFDPQGFIFAANNTGGFPDTFNLNYAAKSQSSITVSITRTDIFGDQTASCWAGQFYFDVVMTD